jgi:hypothetical protein
MYACPSPDCQSSAVSLRSCFKTLYYIECDVCSMRGPYGQTECTAIYRWNNLIRHYRKNTHWEVTPRKEEYGKT